MKRTLYSCDRCRCNVSSEAKLFKIELHDATHCIDWLEICEACSAKALRWFNRHMEPGDLENENVR